MANDVNQLTNDAYSQLVNKYLHLVTGRCSHKLLSLHSNLEKIDEPMNCSSESSHGAVYEI